MLLPSYVASIRYLSSVSRWFVCFAALSFSGCRPLGELSMEEGSEQSHHATSPVDSAVPPGTDDGVLLAQPLSATAPASASLSIGSEGGSIPASFTDDPTLLEPRECQVCDEVTVVPGTVRRIPYVIPPGWCCVNNQVHVVRGIPKLPALDYHVEPLSGDFSFRGAAHQGLLLCASVPATYQHRKRSRRTNDYEVKHVTASLKLKLQVHLAYLPVSKAPELEDGLTVKSTSAASTSVLSLDHIAFGAAAWQKYFGVVVDEEKALPDDIENILNSKAPFLLEEELTFQRIRDNHLLTLIPGGVDGEAFTLDKLGELVLRNHKGYFTSFQNNDKETLGANSHGYCWYSGDLMGTDRRMSSADAPYWVLLPKTILQDSRSETFSKQKAMIARYRSHGYQFPCALEVATSLLAHYARSSGERLYANEDQEGWWTYARCSDVDKDGDPFVVGGFEVSGLDVGNFSNDNDPRIGVACFRKL